MKKFTAIFTLLTIAFLSIVGLDSCDKKAKEEAKYDQQITSLIDGLTFPQQLMDNSTLTGCDYKDKILTYKVEISKDRLNELKTDTLTKRTKTLEKLKTGILPRSLVQLLVKARASVRYVYFNEKDTVDMTLAPQELELSK